jgi:hypothetical protein
MPDKSKDAAPVSRASQERARDEVAKQIIAAERERSDAKTAKLRALRLAKEAADRAAAAAAPQPAGTRRRKKPRQNPE